MSTLTFKNSALKRYYIFKWNGEDGFLKVFRKSTYIYSANTLRCSLKLLKGVLKNDGRYYAKLLRDDLKKELRGVKLLRYVLQKY